MKKRENYSEIVQKDYLPEVSARKERGYQMAWNEASEYLDPEVVVQQILKNTAKKSDQDQICILQMDTKMRVIRENFYTPRQFQWAMSKPANFLRDLILCAPVGLIAVCISKREVPMKWKELARLKYRDREYYREKKRYDDVTLKAAERYAKQLEPLCDLAGVKLADFILTDDEMNEIYSLLDQERLEIEPNQWRMEEMSELDRLAGFPIGDSPVRRKRSKSVRSAEAPVKLAWNQYKYADEPMNTPEAAIRLIQELIQDSDRERLGVINFSGNRPVNFSISAVGQGDFVQVDPKLLLRTTVLSGADTAVLFHNHPSGHLEPSAGDYEMTRRANQLCRLCGITLADHVIVGFGNDYCYSFHKGEEFHALYDSPYMDEVRTMKNEQWLWTERSDCYAVYQIGEDRLERDESYAFMGMDFIQEHGMEVKGSDYDLVYEGPLMAEETLESLYVKFNLERPEDFSGHSMSVSDVVILKRGGEAKAYYVDIYGFAELTNFIHERQEITKQRQEIVHEQQEASCNAIPESTDKDLKAHERQKQHLQPVQRKR